MRVLIFIIRNGHQELAGALRFEDSLIRVNPAPLNPNNEILLKNIISYPIQVLLEGTMTTLTALEHPELFLQYLHRAYTGTYLRASEAMEGNAPDSPAEGQAPN